MNEMMITRYRVVMRHKAFPGTVASRGDFTVVPSGRVRADDLLALDDVSLYCLDDARRCAIFVRTPGVDVTAAAFLYRGQFEGATELYGVPYDGLHALAERVPVPELVFIGSMGRAGTTLLGRALNCLEGVRCLSEPDVYTQVAALRVAEPERESEWVQLVQSCTRLLCRDGGMWVVKLRSMATEILGLLHGAFPEARLLFLYRNGLDWVQSNNRILTRFGVPEWLLKRGMQRLYGRYFPWLGAVDVKAMSFVGLQAWAWAEYMVQVMHHREAGVPVLAVRYEELTDTPEASLRRIAVWCRLPVVGMAGALTVFDVDSQAGTYLSRARLRRNRQPGAVTREMVDTVLTAHPVVKTPDFVLAEMAGEMER